MSVRSHWTTSAEVSVSAFTAHDEIPECYQDNEGLMPSGILRLVIEDTGNMEAIVIDGDLDDLVDLGATIIRRAAWAAAGGV